MAEQENAALVIGASGGIGAAVTAAFAATPDVHRVYAVSRAAAAPPELASLDALQWVQAGGDEAAIGEAATRLAAALSQDNAVLSRVVICLGTLHDAHYQPEKALRQLRAAAMLEVYRINTVLPMLWLAALEPLLRRAPECRVAVLSARVGSIGDNRLGGWYSYRAAKAALNMSLRSAAIELARRAPRVKLLAFHPGTTDTALSHPFQANVPADRLFKPAFVAERLLALMAAAQADGELSYLDWAGEVVPW